VVERIAPLVSTRAAGAREARDDLDPRVGRRCAGLGVL